MSDLPFELSGVTNEPSRVERQFEDTLHRVRTEVALVLATYGISAEVLINRDSPREQQVSVHNLLTTEDDTRICILAKKPDLAISPISPLRIIANKLLYTEPRKLFAADYQVTSNNYISFGVDVGIETLSGFKFQGRYQGPFIYVGVDELKIYGGSKVNQALKPARQELSTQCQHADDILLLLAGLDETSLYFPRR